MLDTTAPTNDGNPQVEDVIAQMNQSKDRAESALIGYARLDILDNKDRLIFGIWNPRKLVNTQLSSLRESFANGVDRFNPLHAMPLVVHRDWLKSNSYLPSWTAGAPLPELKIANGVPDDWKFKAAGGQHRINALGPFVDSRQKQLKELETEANNIESQLTMDTEQNEVDHLNTRLKPEINNLRALVTANGQWLVNNCTTTVSIDSCFSSPRRRFARISCVLYLRDIMTWCCSHYRSPLHFRTRR